MTFSLYSVYTDKKEDFYLELSLRTSLTAKKGREFVTETFKEIAATLEKEGRVYINNFGTLSATRIIRKMAWRNQYEYGAEVRLQPTAKLRKVLGVKRRHAAACQRRKKGRMKVRERAVRAQGILIVPPSRKTQIYIYVSLWPLILTHFGLDAERFQEVLAAGLKTTKNGKRWSRG